MVLWRTMLRMPRWGVARRRRQLHYACPGGPGTINFPTEYMVGKLTSILSNNVVNEARLSLQAYGNLLSNDIPFTDTQVGIAPIIPSINILDTTTITGLMQWGGATALGTESMSPSGKRRTRSPGHMVSTRFVTGFEFERDRSNGTHTGRR